LAAFAAVALLGANLLNKQAFYNQFRLVAALVLAAWTDDGTKVRSNVPAAVERTAVPIPRASSDVGAAGSTV
jgi:hypothetical protein